MPAGDRTGPEGMGPMTGRGAGFCAGFGAPGYMNAGAVAGYGRGRGFGRGHGFRRFGAWGAAMPYAAPTREQQVDVLKEQSRYLESELKAVRDQIEQLESE